MKYQPVIGLEIHVELSTASKMFCACSADYFQKEPNTHTCPVCIGLPGGMPKANESAISLSQKIGIALGCKLKLASKFDRKNYFYPDLAKGFQISQYDLPFSKDGEITINLPTLTKIIGITRAHLEEDTGKLVHTKIEGKNVTLIDFNRSGVPLLEIVSEPHMNSSEEAKMYAQKIQQIIRYVGASDADMEKGSMRIEPNISLRKASESKGSGINELPPYKVELKNINSFKFVQQAIEFELARQEEILDSGEIPKQETRGWNETKSETFSQRSKEDAHDYRYFPEPDLPALSYPQQYFKKLEAEMPELPDQKRQRFQKQFNLSVYDVEILTRSITLAAYFEEGAKAAHVVGISAKALANEIINKKPDIEKIAPAALVAALHKSASKKSTSSVDLVKIVKEVIGKNAGAVADYKSGKTTSIMFLIGQVQKGTNGAANPQDAKKLLEEEIERS